MIKNVLSHIGGVEAYGIVSIALFFIFFLGMIAWAFLLKRNHLDAMGRLPLGDEPPPQAGSHPTSQPDTAHE